MSAPKLWSTQEIADFCTVSVETVDKTIVYQRGFPRPIRVTGKERGDRRWFSDAVIAFYREKAA